MKLVLVGGFLGSGKTTAIVKACQQLIHQNKKVGVITNDQGSQQVDSEYVKSFGIPAGEVANGCFCCNYDQLDSELQSLREKDQPEIIFAESVGSCTDLIATLVKPLNNTRPDIKIVVSVFADAELLSSLIEGNSSFLEDSVRYLYRKQLEEADFLVLNKTDLLKPKQLGTVDKVLKSAYPNKIILHQNSLRDQDISRWLESMEQFTQYPKRNSLTLDYDVYGEAEGKLAWLDKRITITTANDNCVFVIRKIIGSIFNQIQTHHFTIGHLKFFLAADDWNEKVSFTTTSTSEDVSIRDHRTNSIRVLINARVQTNPMSLEKLVDDVLTKAEGAYQCTIVTENRSSYKPDYPRPTHRMG
ncbi:MAG: CobW-like GTP-binding protein [Cyclobacteriaceae bacterium]|nr:CobW-like GTP-binding protein [Cyclobacteriaceae bacterium]MDH4295989.1 CobW-like GTP-binding protein [Cyclobacteriaceae bacterium]MDH5250292.1 CobW-like GTP-binding protein [Cyclobacteriaceae bacterium]